MALIKRTSGRFSPRVNEYSYRSQATPERKAARIKVVRQQAQSAPVATSKRERRQ